MKRSLYFVGITLISVLLAAGCAKEGTMEGPGTDAPASGSGDEVSGISDSGESIGFQIDESSSESGDSQSGSGGVDPLSQRTVYFEYDEAIVSDEAQTIIRAHADVLLENPDANLQISGHADERGTREYNLALGDLRAQAVSVYFQNYGVDVARISVISYGEENPASIGADEDSWRLNRRADFDY